MMKANNADWNRLAELWEQLAANPHSMALVLAVDELASKLGASVPVY